MKAKIGSNRSFGVVFFIVFLIIALWPLQNNNDIRIWSLIISLIFLFLGIFNSKLLNPLNILWYKFGIFLENNISNNYGFDIFYCSYTHSHFIKDF